MSKYFIKLIVIAAMGCMLSMPAFAQTPGADSVRLTDDSAVLQNKDTLQVKDTLQNDVSNKPSHLYRMNYWVSGVFCGVATVADVYAIPTIIKSKPDLTAQELQSVNRNAVPSFDRWALQQNPAQRQMYLNAADYGLPVVILIPGLLALNKNVRKDWARILLMYYEMHAITFSMYNFSFFGPAFQDKYRPVIYYTQLPIDERAVGNNRNSMYSGHAATAAASMFFMVKVYNDYHPEIGGKKYLLYALSTIPAFAIGYFRVMGLEHFPSDVMIGVTIGAVCGILVPEVHRFKNHKVMFGVSSSPTGGAGMSMLWNMD